MNTSRRMQLVQPCGTLFVINGLEIHDTNDSNVLLPCQ